MTYPDLSRSASGDGHSPDRNQLPLDSADRGAGQRPGRERPEGCGARGDGGGDEQRVCALRVRDGVRVDGGAGDGAIAGRGGGGNGRRGACSGVS